MYDRMGHIETSEEGCDDGRSELVGIHILARGEHPGDCSGLRHGALLRHRCSDRRVDPDAERAPWPG